jgi:glycosyltransferase involved in cell wall biosynthesis
VSDPLVSIVVNNYNYARFLGDAIDSALNQSYPRVEVVVVDDGSTDHSHEVITAFGRRILPIFKENGGQASAYNAGFAKASGDIVCFLDADDELFDDAVASAVPQFVDRVVKVQWPLVSVDAHGGSRGPLVTTQRPPDGDLLQRVVREGPLYDFHYVTGAAYTRGSIAPVYGTLATLPDARASYRLHPDNNYRNRPLDDDRLRNYVGRYETNASVLAEHLRGRGVNVRPQDWYATAFNYLWPTRALAAREAIRAGVPDGDRFVLIDGMEWGDPAEVEARVAVRVLERDGVYWGHPPDDAAAICHVQRLRGEGIRHLLLWWTCFWWLDAYPQFATWIDACSARRSATDAFVLVQFDDGPGAG